MLSKAELTNRAPHWLANATFLLAGYAVGDIVVTVIKLTVG